MQWCGVMQWCSALRAGHSLAALAQGRGGCWLFHRGSAWDPALGPGPCPWSGSGSLPLALSPRGAAVAPCSSSRLGSSPALHLPEREPFGFCRRCTCIFSRIHGAHLLRAPLPRGTILRWLTAVLPYGVQDVKSISAEALTRCVPAETAGIRIFALALLRWIHWL